MNPATRKDPPPEPGAWRRDRTRILPAFLLAPVAGFLSAYALLGVQAFAGEKNGADGKSVPVIAGPPDFAHAADFALATGLSDIALLAGGFFAGGLAVTLIGLIAGPPVMFLLGLPTHALVSRLPFRIDGIRGAVVYGLAGGSVGIASLMAFRAIDRGGARLWGFAGYLVPGNIPVCALAGSVAGLVFWRLRIASRVRRAHGTSTHE